MTVFLKIFPESGENKRGKAPLILDPSVSYGKEESLYFRLSSSLVWWEKLDSNQRRPKPADLQSAPFDHSGILPYAVWWGLQESNLRRTDLRSVALPTELRPHGVRERDRTADLPGHNRMLWPSELHATYVVCLEGLEPSACRLKAGCSTTELKTQIWCALGELNPQPSD